MVEYKCFRCGYKASQKIGLVRHLKRKNICSPKVDDIWIESIIKYYGFEMTPNCSKIAPNCSNGAPENINNVAPNCSNGAPNCSKFFKNEELRSRYAAVYVGCLNFKYFF